MTGSAPIRIVAQVTEPECHAMRVGAGFLTSALRKVSKESPPPSISLLLASTQIDCDTLPDADIYVLSIRCELERSHEPHDAVLARWTSDLEKLQRHHAAVFLCTVFRVVGEQAGPGSPSDTLARIRTLNLAVVRLSRMFGVFVIDIDQVLAHLGERVVRSDHSLRHTLAVDAAGHAMARTILASSLDKLFDPMDQENALKALGGIDALPRLLRQREEHRIRLASANG